MTEKLHVCLLDGVAEEGKHVFSDTNIFRVSEFPNSLPKNELISELSHAHIIGIRSKTKLDEEVIRNMKNALCIGRYGVGVNNIDLLFAKSKGIPVFNGPFSNTRSVAELAIGIIFGLLRKIPEKSSKMHKGEWPKSAKSCFEVRGKTLGLVGYGNIAAQISVIAEAIGMNVVYSDVRPVLPMGKAKQIPFQEVLKNADVVSLHVPGLPSTKNMMNTSSISQMKKGAYLINLSRGSVVDIPALKKALESGHLLGAALDVFPQEPKLKQEKFVSELKEIPNVILTPHIGGATEEAQSSIGEEVSEKMKNYALYGNSGTALNFPQIFTDPPKDTNTHRIIVTYQYSPETLREVKQVIDNMQRDISSSFFGEKDALGTAIINGDQKIMVPLFNTFSSFSSLIKCRILS
jgi:D-3-phosphoglycerate dehydrogenase